MSLHRANKDQLANESIDYLIRWALQDSVAGVEPSPQVWERIEQRIAESANTATASALVRRNARPRRSWLSQLIGAGAPFPVPGDPRLAWQRRLFAFDMRAPLSIVRIVEGKMPFLRLVA